MSLVLGWRFQVAPDKEPQAVWRMQLIAPNKCLTVLKGGLPVQLSVLKGHFWEGVLGFSC